MNLIRKLFRKKVVKVENGENDHKEMETLENCEIVIDIQFIERISGGEELFEIYFSASTGEKYKLVFDWVWDLRYCIENAVIVRSNDFIRNAQKRSSILYVRNSEYIKYFEQQVSGTRPTDELKDYIMFDEVDTVLEILTTKKPKLIKLDGISEVDSARQVCQRGG